MAKQPTWIPETRTVTKEVPTGHMVCDCCYGRKESGHKLFCYWYWHPRNKAKDDAEIKKERATRVREARGRV